MIRNDSRELLNTKKHKKTRKISRYKKCIKNITRDGGHVKIPVFGKTPKMMRADQGVPIKRHIPGTPFLEVFEPRVSIFRRMFPEV